VQIWSWSGFFDYLLNPFLLEGAVTTLWLTVASLSAGLVLGIGLALMRLSGNPVLSGIAAFYCWVFRGTPLLVQLLIIYTGLPLFGLRFSVVQAALLGLALNEAAYLSETVRAGILAVARGQREAALALGLRRIQVFRLVIWPQALRIIIPPLTNQYLNLTKNSSLAVAIGYPAVVSIANTALNQTGRAVECIALVMAVYLCTSLLTALLMNAYNQRVALQER
jgi:polar amino acid transport system permease protein